MTTIVCNRTTMAGDSQLTGTHKSSAKKVWAHKGSCIGIAGEYQACVTFVKWLTGQLEDEPDMEAVDAMVLTKDGRILHYNGSLNPFEIDDDYGAIGSGSQAAIAAMHMGADPARAIEVASLIDPGTGGKVQVHHIKPSKRKPANG